MRAFASIAAVLLASACSEPPPYDLRRESLVPEQAGSAGRPVREDLVAGDVARPGIVLPDAQRRAVAKLENLTSGQLVVHVARGETAPPGGGARVSLRDAGWRSQVGVGFEAGCRLQWGAAGTTTNPSWQTCLLDLPPNLRSALVVVERDPGTRGDLLISDVHVRGTLSSSRPSVFVLMLDAARFDGLRPFADSAPFGDQLVGVARDALLLREVRSSSSWTRPAVSTLFTGLRADRHGVHDRGDKLADGFVTLPELLRDNGYATWAWSANANVLPLWGLAQGFDAFVDQGSRTWASAKTDGAEMVDRLRGALTVRGPEPGFYYLHLMDPHGPYLPSSEQKRAAGEAAAAMAEGPPALTVQNRPADKDAFLSYLGELLDTDEHIGAFAQLLHDEDLYEQSLVLIVADHGEEFLDHEGHDHGRTLYEEVLRVPALLKLPGNRWGGRVFESPLSLEDLTPTVLDAIGLAVPSGLDGRIAPLAGDRDFPVRPHVATLHLDGRRQRAIVEPPWKLIHDEVRGSLELYDLASDPHERRNVADARPEIRQRLDASLRAALHRSQQGWHVLVCGTMTETSLDLSVRAPRTTPTFLGFEAREVVAEGGAGGDEVLRLRPVLTPIRLPRETLIRATDLVLPRRPEVLLVPAPESADQPSMLEISSGGVAFAYRLGQAGPLERSKKILLRAARPDVRVDPAALVECDEPPSTARTDPFLRIWFIAPAESLPDEELDPALRERLRALGYLD